MAEVAAADRASSDEAARSELDERSDDANRPNRCRCENEVVSVFVEFQVTVPHLRHAGRGVSRVLESILTNGGGISRAMAERWRIVRPNMRRTLKRSSSMTTPDTATAVEQFSDLVPTVDSNTFSREDVLAVIGLFQRAMPMFETPARQPEPLF